VRFAATRIGVSLLDGLANGPGSPVSIGIAPTKTLAKVANRLAKKDPAANGVRLLLTREEQEAALTRLAQMGRARLLPDGQRKYFAGPRASRYDSKPTKLCMKESDLAPPSSAVRLPHDFARALQEDLHYWTECSVLQHDRANRSLLCGQCDGQDFQDLLCSAKSDD
jgi:hypothetical protein